MNFKHELVFALQQLWSARIKDEDVSVKRVTSNNHLLA